MNDSCRTHAQSHAATVPPSNGATCRSSASQKAQIVYLVSYNTTFREQTHIRWCCIDLLRPPRLSDGMRRPVSTGCVTLPVIDVLEAQEKGNRLSIRLPLSRSPATKFST